MQQYTADDFLQSKQWSANDKGTFDYNGLRSLLEEFRSKFPPPPSSHQGDFRQEALAAAEAEYDYALTEYGEGAKNGFQVGYILAANKYSQPAPPTPGGEDTMFDFIGWILEQGYEVVTNRTGPHFGKKDATTIVGVRKLYREYLKENPKEPTPVGVDFEKAMTEKLDTIEENGIGLDSRWYNFEAGARWARQHLASIPEIAGPWHLKSHSNSEDDDTVWMTDGKLSIYIDEFNFDDFPEADYWLVNFLNKYHFKLSIDNPAPLIISHLEEQVKELQGRKGLRWVKATERLPENGKTLPIKLMGDYRFGYLAIHIDKSAVWYIKDALTWSIPEERFYQIEWLEESDSPAPKQVDVVDLIKWMTEECQINYDGELWKTPENRLLKPAELLELYKQQNKQG